MDEERAWVVRKVEVLEQQVRENTILLNNVVTEIRFMREQAQHAPDRDFWKNFGQLISGVGMGVAGVAYAVFEIWKSARE